MPLIYAGAGGNLKKTETRDEAASSTVFLVCCKLSGEIRITA